MATNLSVESPDFDRIRKGDSSATEDAVRLLWYVLNDEIRKRRIGDRRIEDRLSPKILTKAPSGAENNIDTEGAGLIVYTGSTAVTQTGYRVREEGDIIFILVTGTGTISHAHQSASSDAGNRIVTYSGNTKAVATNQSMVLIYQSSRWRELSLA